MSKLMTASAAALMAARAATAGENPRGIVAVRADASGIEKVIEELNRTFSAYTEKNDKRIEGVAAKFDDVVTSDELTKIDARLSELQSAVDQHNAAMAANGLNGGQGQTVNPEYVATFSQFMREGDDGIRASLKKTPDGDGGYVAPLEWDRTITDALVEVDPMRQIARTQMISTRGFKKVYNLRGTTSGWVGEAAGRPETDTPEFGQMEFALGEIYANPGITQQLLDDAEVDLEAWLAGEVELEFAYQEGLAFIAGNGTNKPFGFLTFATGQANANRNPLGAIEVVPAAAQAAVTEDELLDLQYALPSSYTANARYVMNRPTAATVRKLRDADGRQLWQPSSAAGEPATLLGYAASELPGMPDMAASALPIAFGDFQRGYLIVDGAGVSVLRDPFTNKPFVHFYTTKRVGGGVDDPQAIKVLQMAA